MVAQVQAPAGASADSAAIPQALGGMLGIGVIVGLAPAAAAAGVWLFAGVALAAVTAACCAFTTSAQSAAYPGPGSAYVCLRSRFGLLPARIGASTALAGHIAALAAVTRVIGEHLVPSQAPGVAGVVLLGTVLAATTGLRIRGAAAWSWLGLTLVIVAVVATAAFAIAPAPSATQSHGLNIDHAAGITGAAGVLFFAYAGFERLSMPAQRRDRYQAASVRRGLLVSLVAVTVVAAVVGGALLYQLGPDRLGLSPTPMLEALGAAAAGTLTPAVRVGIALALLPVLLGVLESTRSTALAVVREGDLPRRLARRGRAGTPFLLDLAAGIAAVGLVWVLDPARAIGFAACCLLVHYALANAAGRLLLTGGRTWAPRVACLGMGLSVVLAVSMPVGDMLGTLAVVVTGPLLFGLASRRWR